MGLECSEKQYQLTSAERAKMAVKMSLRDVGCLSRTDWHRGHGINVTLGLSAEVMFIVAGQALGIPWDKVRSAMGWESCDHVVEATFTIPELMLASYTVESEQGVNTDDGTSATEDQY